MGATRSKVALVSLFGLLLLLAQDVGARLYAERDKNHQKDATTTGHFVLHQFIISSNLLDEEASNRRQHQQRMMRNSNAHEHEYHQHRQLQDVSSSITLSAGDEEQASAEVSVGAAPAMPSSPQEPTVLPLIGSGGAPDGELCRIDSDCESLHCETTPAPTTSSTTTGASTGVCKSNPLQPVPPEDDAHSITMQTCLTESECNENVACALRFGHEEKGNVCCPTDATTQFFSSQYCALENENICATDRMCISGHCSPTSFLCSNPLAGLGEACNESLNDCSNGACGYRVGSEAAGAFCCLTGMTIRHTNGLPYCADRANGRPCAPPSNGMCRSGYCEPETNLCADEPPPPGAEPGTFCRQQTDCQTGACAYNFAAEPGGLVCCENSSMVLSFEGGHELFFCVRGSGNRCGFNGMCTTNFCDPTSSRCSSLREPNVPCQQDVQCESGACGMVFGFSSNGSVCCQSGATTIYEDGLAYCAFQPNGTPCGSASMCLSEHCNSGGLCSDPTLAPSQTPTEVPPQKDGDPCEEDIDCEKLACGVLFGDEKSEGQTICCPSGATTQYNDGQFYCALMENGHGCLSDAFCLGFCSPDTKLCAEPLARDGDPCEEDIGCENLACGVQYGDETTEGPVCCPSGVTVQYDGDGLWYCAQMENGSACLDYTFCDSTHCDQNTGLCSDDISLDPSPAPSQTPTAVPSSFPSVAPTGVASSFPSVAALEDGDPCEEDNDCKKRACGVMFGDDTAEGPVCCPSGATARFHDQYYCSRMEDGSPCLFDSLCASRYCNPNNDLCSEPLARDGDLCEEDVGCESLACGVMFGDETTEGSAVCCPSGATALYDGDGLYYCALMADGSPCLFDSACSSGFCSPDTNLCAEPLAREGEPCENDIGCENLACAIPYGDKTAEGKICCPSGVTARYDGDGLWYCALIENGSACPSDMFCDENSFCHPLSGVCRDPVRVGEPCNVDSDCVTGAACARNYGFGGAVCCEETTLFNGAPYCAAVNGRPCAHNDLCISANCDVSSGTCQPPLLATGEPCSEDSVCTSGKCGAFYGFPGQVCCPSGEATVFSGLAFCSRQLGAPCMVDGMCTSSFCDPGSNTCQPLLAGIGETCQGHEGCASGSCGSIYGDEEGGDASASCCESGQTVEVAGEPFCSNVIGIGSNCAGSNALCVSGSCSDQDVCEIVPPASRESLGENDYNVGCAYVAGEEVEMRRARRNGRLYTQNWISAKCPKRKTPWHWFAGTSEEGCDDDWVGSCEVDKRDVWCQVWVGRRDEVGGSPLCSERRVKAKVHLLCC